LCIIILATHPVQVEKEADHKISSQDDAPGVLHIVIAGRAGNALVLVQDIVDGELKLPVLLFEQLLAETGIPQGYALIIPFAKTAVNDIIEIGRKNKILREGIAHITGIALGEIVHVRLQRVGIRGRIIRYIGLDTKIDLILVDVYSRSLGDGEGLGSIFYMS
jgi:hypothetical protein